MPKKEPPSRWVRPPKEIIRMGSKPTSVRAVRKVLKSYRERLRQEFDVNVSPVNLGLGLREPTDVLKPRMPVLDQLEKDTFEGEVSWEGYQQGIENRLATLDPSSKLPSQFRHKTDRDRAEAQDDVFRWVQFFEAAIKKFHPDSDKIFKK
ncbi:MAG: hypothetical protein GOV15_01760 [Candidatus Diapherotrites archaeon]|nr:hypothetical protein [Candidatus Diapherotrites archaeon]